MKKTFQSLILFAFIFSIVSGCSEQFKKGALETMELWASGNAYYNAKFLDESEFTGTENVIYADPKNASNNLVKYYHYYHPDASPRKLGYTEGPHVDSDGRDMWYNKDGYTNPGEGGVWSNGQKSTGSGGAISGCPSSYNNPIGDAQLDAYCGYAWLYRCQQGKPLSDPGVQAVCKAYNDIKTSSAPSCPYCK